MNNNHIKIYKFIKKHHEINGYSPSYREISKACSIKSLSSVYSYLSKLRELGYIDWHDNIPRSIVIK